MKVVTRSIAVAAVVVSLAAGAAFADSTPVRNDSFGITLPDGFGEFATQSQKSKAPEGGEIETTNWVSKAPTGEAVVVTVSRMPGKVLDPQKLMASTRDTLVASLKATVESEESAAADSMSLLFKGQSENPPYLRSHLGVRDNLFYQLLYVGRSEEQRSNPAIGQLFDSFEIAEPAAQTAAE